MENFRRDLRELTVKCFEGEITLAKVNLWLALLTCLLAGIVYGLRKGYGNNAKKESHEKEKRKKARKKRRNRYGFHGARCCEKTSCGGW